jgi:DNA polymerase III subunit beta
METAITQKDLAAGLALVLPAAARRPTLDVLKHVLVQAENGHVRLHCSDLEVFLSCKVPAVSEAEGGFTVPVRMIKDFVSSLPNDRVDLIADDTEMRIECGMNHAAMNGIAAEEFPIIPTIGPETVKFELDPEVLLDGLRKTTFSAATDETRPVLTTVLVKIAGDSLVMASADGFRLSTYETKLEGIEAEEDERPLSITAMIPATALEHLAKLLKSEKEPVQVMVNEGQVTFLLAGSGSLSDIVLTSQLIAGKFVNYQQIVPKAHATRVTVDRLALIRDCKRAQVFARQEANVLRITATPEQGDTSASLTLVAESTDSGNNKSVLKADIEGDGLMFALNVAFLLQALEAFDGEQVVIDLGGSPAQPVKLWSSGDNGYLHVMMPMHLREKRKE